jgi:hypothetical protein
VTLATTLITPGYQVHVSDRPAAGLAAGGLPLGAPMHNVVLCRAADAVAVFATSGPAHVDGVPVDHWLAERVAGIPIRVPPPPVTPLRSERRPDIGFVFERVRAGLAGIGSAAGEDRPPLEVLVTGWRWRRLRRPRPVQAIVWALRHSATGTGTWRVELPPPAWYHAWTPAGRFDQDTAAAIRGRKARWGTDPFEDVDELAAALCEHAAQRASTPAPGRPASGPAAREVTRIILPRTTALGAIRILAEGERPLPDGAPSAAASPWIVGPRAVLAPGAGLGSWRARFGDREVHLISRMRLPG